MCSSNKTATLCRMINNKNDLYNPLIEKENTIHPGHWYHVYKIEFTPIEYEGVIERFYFSAFCSLLKSDKAKIV